MRRLTLRPRPLLPQWLRRRNNMRRRRKRFMLRPRRLADDPITQIERLGALKAQGLITEEEFNAQKAKILGL